MRKPPRFDYEHGGVAKYAQLTFQIDFERGELASQVSRQLTQQILGGHLSPGERLPSVRQISKQLGVARKTIFAALDALEAEGLVHRKSRSGISIADPLPLEFQSPSEARPSRTPCFPLRTMVVERPASPRSEFELLGGVPDLHHFPKKEVAASYRRVLIRDTRSRLFDYADPRGHPALRDALAQWLARTRGVRVDRDSIMIVRGSQHGLYLAARSLLLPEDAVAVESYAHPAIVSLLRLVQAKLVPIPIDENGLNVDALERVCSRHRVRALYLTPHHQLPTTVTLSAPRRKQLLQLAARRRFMIWEDDYDHEFQYEGLPVLPLAHADDAGAVIYFSTLSKVIAPGLRAGFVVASPPVIDRLAQYRNFVDRQGDHVSERMLAELLEEGDIERHIRRMRITYRIRRDALCLALNTHLPELKFRTPSGGMAVWAQASGIDVDQWFQRAKSRSVVFQPASLFAVAKEAPRDFVRLGFAALPPKGLQEAVLRMSAAL